MSRFRLVVFDLDGTLVDSRRDIAESANATLASFGATPLPEATIGRMVGNGAPVLVARAFEAAGVSQPDGALDRFLTIYDARLLEHTRPYPGMIDVLAAMADRVSLGVLTNKPLGATRLILEGLDLTRFFASDLTIAGDGAFPRKPDPAGLCHLIAVAGSSPGETVLVGDSIIDRRTAAAANARACLARYGFGWEGFPFEEPSPDDWVIDGPMELLRLLE